jgi:hypothetical protein
LTKYNSNTEKEILEYMRKLGSLIEFICQYRTNWKEHVDWIPKSILKYQPKGKEI